MDKVAIGTAGLKGWREKVGNAVAGPTSRHTPLGAEQVRAVIGGAFFLLSLVYVSGTLKRMLARSA